MLKTCPVLQKTIKQIKKHTNKKIKIKIKKEATTTKNAFSNIFLIGFIEM